MLYNIIIESKKIDEKVGRHSKIITFLIIEYIRIGVDNTDYSAAVIAGISCAEL